MLSSKAKGVSLKPKPGKLGSPSSYARGKCKFIATGKSRQKNVRQKLSLGHVHTPRDSKCPK